MLRLPDFRYQRLVRPRRVASALSAGSERLSAGARRAYELVSPQATVAAPTEQEQETADAEHAPRDEELPQRETAALPPEVTAPLWEAGAPHREESPPPRNAAACAREQVVSLPAARLFTREADRDDATLIRSPSMPRDGARSPMAGCWDAARDSRHTLDQGASTILSASSRRFVKRQLQRGAVEVSSGARSAPVVAGIRDCASQYVTLSSRASALSM